jgi:RimJ/RimL family protein N-acetyltransferase
MTITLDDVDWPVRTDRLLLRRATTDDVDATYEIRSRPGVSEWLANAPSSRADHAARFTDPDRLARLVAIELADDPGRVIGDLMIRIEDAWAQAEVADAAVDRQAELGWVLDPAHHGHGYATEAVLGALEVCFERLGLHRVTAGCFAANERSWRLMERVGMRREATTVRDSLHRSGEWMDGYEYAVLDDEWLELVRPMDDHGPTSG